MASVQQKFHQAEAALLETIDFVPSEYDNYVFLTQPLQRCRSDA